MKRAFFSLLLTVLAFSSGRIFGQDKALGQKEYHKKLKSLNSHYRDFYLHRKAKERRLLELLDSAATQRKLRKRRKQIREKRRKAYVLKRRQMPSPKNYKSQYLKGLEKRKKVREKFRREYVKRRKVLEAIRQSIHSIPEKEESGLMDPLEELR